MTEERKAEALSTEKQQDSLHEGREKYFIDVDRMVSEGLGGGYVTEDNGLIEETTTTTMDDVANNEIITSNQKGKAVRDDT